MHEISWPHLAAGIVLCLAGWTLYWIGLNLAGAAVGGAAGAALAWGIVSLAGIGHERAVWIIPIAGVVGAALGMFFIRKLHRLSFFLVGAAIGVAVGWVGYAWVVAVGKNWLEQRSIVPDPMIWRGVSVLVCSIVGGALMVIGSKWVIAALTSVAGAVLMAVSIQDPLALLAIVPVAGASFFFQLGLLRRLSPKKKEKEEEKDTEER
jgi:hypothetical protein